MIINAIKNLHFTRLIKANGRLREFNFRKSNTTPEGWFHVDVSDDRGNRVMFRMEKEGNQWTIQEAGVLPQWVSENEKELHQLIEEELAAA